jgi:hypothetical protein
MFNGGGNMDYEPLFHGRCVLTVRFKDGSEIQSITTLNRDILESLELEKVDGLVDLINLKLIPPELIARNDTQVVITPGTKLTLNPLDALFQDSIKRYWESAV